MRSELGHDPARMADVLAGVRAYQAAPRGERVAPAPIVAQAGRACVRAFGGGGPPVLFIPSLINPPTILDLDAERSLLRWLATRGVRPLLVDWGSPASAERDLTIADHVERLLLPLIDALGEPPVLAGYCLGGTMALAAAALRPARGLALIAAPWRFAGFPDAARDGLAGLWATARAPAEALGLMPMEMLQAAFWQLDPLRTLVKFEAFGKRAADPAAVQAFVAVEDWANDGPPLTLAAARELIESLFGEDRPGTGRWQVSGRTIDPAALRMPVLEIVSTTDRIVPAAAAAGIGERLPLALGHVGMIVGGRARAAVWQPLAAWLSRITSTC